MQTLLLNMETWTAHCEFRGVDRVHFGIRAQLKLCGRNSAYVPHSSKTCIERFPFACRRWVTGILCFISPLRKRRTGEPPPPHPLHELTNCSYWSAKVFFFFFSIYQPGVSVAANHHAITLRRLDLHQGLRRGRHFLLQNNDGGRSAASSVLELYPGQQEQDDDSTYYILWETPSPDEPNPYFVKHPKSRKPTGVHFRFQEHFQETRCWKTSSSIDSSEKALVHGPNRASHWMGLVRITSWYPNSNGSHPGLSTKWPDWVTKGVMTYSQKELVHGTYRASHWMGLVRITSCSPKSNGSHFGLPPMSGLGGKRCE